MATPETKFKDAGRKFLNETFGQRIWYFKVLGSEGQKSGVPDIVGCLDGKFFGVELKVKPNKPSDKQLYEIEKITAAGGAAAVIWNMDELKEFMRCLARS